jgi:hypothetical protein
MKHLMAGVILILSFSAFSQKLQFQKEKLDFSITENKFKLDGLYFFKNLSEDTIKQFILYPFPQSPGLGEVVSIKIEEIYPKADTTVMVNFNQKAACFRLKVNPNDSAIIHIIYMQSVPEHQTEYILTTTRNWKQPLEQAKFRLFIPIDTKIDSLSYDADSLLIVGNQLVYKWYFRDFMPDRNFFVSFSKIETTKK